MNRKFLWIIVLAFILLGTFAAASADQDGRNCWCNIDEYGCWITNEDGGKTYIMFWSEEARQYIMGSGSAPYKFVVEKPGETGFLTMMCGSPAPVIIPTAGPDEPANECDDITEYNSCLDGCKRADCDVIEQNCVSLQACIASCNSEYPNCGNQ